MGDTRATAVDETEVGSYFVANYPPFSVWTADAVERDALPALSSPAAPVPLGLYLHVPFCRKRCHFCYFRVYTDKNAQEVEEYLDVMAREWELYHTYPAINGRPLNFVYFGGGTPSFLSVRQLSGLVQRLTAVTPWTSAEEITFECEPGTLTEPKLAAIRELGVTRLSLGIENFDDHILEINGRAHRSAEILRAYQFAQSLGFPQINIDLIAGMLGETEENWQRCVEKTIELAPDSVTVYQMELPFNTTISSDVLKGHRPLSGARRELVDQAPLGRRGVRGAAEGGLHDRQRVHRGQGSRAHEVHLSRSPVAGRRSRRARRGVVRPHQRRPHAEPRHSGRPTARRSATGALPLSRAYRPDQEERLIRELVLQLKLGRVRPPYFADEVRRRYPAAVRRAAALARRGRVSRRGHERHRLADSRGASARRLAPSTVLSAETCGHPVHVSAPTRITSTDGMLFPLDFVYARSGVELPQVKAIDPDDIPLPYRSLLVHHTDMTLTLERHFGGRVALRPLATFLHGPWYFRRVLLAQEYTGPARLRWAPSASRSGAFPSAFGSRS